jgi:predicted transcriptional regulator
LLNFGGVINGRGSVRGVITGPQDFDRQVLFTVDEMEAEITERVRRTMEE